MLYLCLCPASTERPTRCRPVPGAVPAQYRGLRDTWMNDLTRGRRCKLCTSFAQMSQGALRASRALLRRRTAAAPTSQRLLCWAHTRTARGLAAETEGTRLTTGDDGAGRRAPRSESRSPGAAGRPGACPAPSPSSSGQGGGTTSGDQQVLSTERDLVPQENGV